MIHLYRISRRRLPLATALVLGIIFGLLSAPGAARADYLLASGDVLEITVFRVPELTREIRVDVDGRIAYPPLGRLDVQGESVDDLALRIRKMLTENEILSDPQVTVALTTTRPVFIGGDVTTPGAYPFQAGLTVRRAIALAGGLGIARSRGLDEVSALGGERDLAAIDLLREQGRLARIEALLTGAESLAPPPPAGPGVSAPRRAEILALEAQKLVAARAEAQEEKAHLARSVALVRSRIDTLAEQRSLQERLMTRQTEEITRIRAIQDRGLTSQARVAEEQRLLDTIQERAAANETEMAAAREALEGATYALDRFDDRLRDRLETEKQEALLAIQAGRARFAAAGRRLAELGASDAGRLTAVIHRPGDGGPAGTPAGFDTPLQPGDTLDILFETPGLEAGDVAADADAAGGDGIAPARP